MEKNIFFVFHKVAVILPEEMFDEWIAVSNYTGL